MDELTTTSNCSSHTQPPHLTKSRTRAPHDSNESEQDTMLLSDSDNIASDSIIFNTDTSVNNNNNNNSSINDESKASASSSFNDSVSHRGVKKATHKNKKEENNELRANKNKQRTHAYNELSASATSSPTSSSNSSYFQTYKAPVDKSLSSSNKSTIASSQKRHLDSKHSKHDKPKSENSTSSTNRRKVKRHVQRRRRRQEQEQRTEEEPKVHSSNTKQKEEQQKEEEKQNINESNVRAKLNAVQSTESSSLTMPHRNQWTYSNDWAVHNKTAKEIAPLLHITVEQNSESNTDSNNNNNNSYRNRGLTSQQNSAEVYNRPRRSSCFASGRAAKRSQSTPFTDFATSKVAIPVASNSEHNKHHHEHHHHNRNNKSLQYYTEEEEEEEEEEEQEEEHQEAKYKKKMESRRYVDRDDTYRERKFKELQHYSNTSNNNYNNSNKKENSPNAQNKPVTVITIPGLRLYKSSSPSPLELPAPASSPEPERYKFSANTVSTEQSNKSDKEEYTTCNNKSELMMNEEKLNVINNAETKNKSLTTTNNNSYCIKNSEGLSSAVHVVEVELQERVHQLRVLQKMYNKLNNHNNTLAREFNELRTRYGQLRTQLAFRVSNEVRHVRADFMSLKRFTRLVLDDFRESISSTINELVEALPLHLQICYVEEQEQLRKPQDEHIKALYEEERQRLPESLLGVSTSGLYASKTHAIANHFQHQLCRQQEELEKSLPDGIMSHKNTSHFDTSAQLVPLTSHDWFDNYSSDPRYSSHLQTNNPTNVTPRRCKHGKQNARLSSLIKTKQATEFALEHTPESLASSPPHYKSSAVSTKMEMNKMEKTFNNGNNYNNCYINKSRSSSSSSSTNMKKSDNDIVVSIHSSSNESSRSNSRRSSIEKKDEQLNDQDGLLDRLHWAEREVKLLRNELYTSEEQWQERMANIKDAHKAREMTLTHELELVKRALANRHQLNCSLDHVKSDTNSTNNNIKTQETNELKQHCGNSAVEEEQLLIQRSNPPKIFANHVERMHKELQPSEEQQSIMTEKQNCTLHYRDVSKEIDKNEEYNNTKEQLRNTFELQKNIMAVSQLDNTNKTNTSHNNTYNHNAKLSSPQEERNMTHDDKITNSHNSSINVSNSHINSANNYNTNKKILTWCNGVSTVNSRSQVPEVERRVKALVARSLHQSHRARAHLLNDLIIERDRREHEHLINKINPINNEDAKDINTMKCDNVNNHNDEQSTSYETQVHNELMERARYYLETATNTQNKTPDSKQRQSSKVQNGLELSSQDESQQKLHSPSKTNDDNKKSCVSKESSPHKRSDSTKGRKRSPKVKSIMETIANGLWAENVLAQRQRSTNV